MAAEQADAQARVERLVSQLRASLAEQQADPDNPIPCYNSGLLYSQLGDFPAAVRSYRLAVERKPSFFQGYYNLGLALSAQGLWSDAEQAYRQGLRHNDTDAECWGNLGGVYEQLGRGNDALECYKRALAINPAEWQVRVHMGRIYYDRGELERAREMFEAAVVVNEQDAEAWNALGLVQFHQDLLPEAQQSYLKALQVNNGMAQAWNNLGNLFARLGNPAAAEQAYRDGTQHDPDDPDIWYNLGEFYLGQDHPDTERCLRRAVELTPQDLEAWQLLRRWYQRHPNPIPWKTALLALVAALPQDRALLRELALVHERLGEQQEALDRLRQVLALDPHDEGSRLLATRIYLKQGLLQEAFRHMGQVQSATQEVLELWKHLGQRLMHHDQPEKAETCFITVVAHQPWASDLWQVLGDLAYRREQWTVAYERFGRASDMNRNDTSVWWPLAQRFLAAKDPVRAADCLDHLADLWAHLPGQWEAYFPAFQAAGRAGPFLERLESLMRQGLLPEQGWLELARLYDLAGMGEKASACLRKVEGTAGELERRRMLARQCLERQDGQAALEHLKHLAAHAERDPGYWTLVGDAEYLVGNLAAALKAYEKAAALDPQDFRARFKIGNIRFRQGHFQHAEQAFREAAALHPEESKIWYNLACSLAEQSQWGAARDGFERALALDRRFAQAWNWLGTMHLRQGSTLLARRCYVRCVAVNRSSGTGWHNLGMLYRHLGQEERAVLCLARAATLGGAPPGAGAAPVKLFFDRDPRQGA
jgi:tetratricopeptide (TPR) repeat protein